MHKISQLASDCLNSAALANQRPADKFVCIIFPYSIEGPKCLNFFHTKSRLLHCDTDRSPWLPGPRAVPG